MRREGLASTLERVRFELGWRRRQARRAALPLTWPQVEVLHVLGAEPHPGRGGVERALLDRLEATPPPWALLAPRRSGQAELEIRLQGGTHAGVVASDLDAALMLAVAAHLRAQIVQVENLAPFDPAQLLPLVDSPVPTVLGLHDLGALCPRPHLFDAAAQRYCNASTDPVRCRRCRAAAGEPPTDHRRWRDQTTQLLHGAAAVVVPSAWLRATLESALPLASGVRWYELAPATRPEQLDPAPWTGRRVGLLGTLRAEKGADLIRAALERLPTLEAVQCGPVGPDFAQWAGRRLRRRGFYRPGTLGSQLRRHRVGLALIASIVPESHSLVADEAWRAGVPVLAFEHGALMDRVGRDGPGALLPLEADFQAAVEALVAALEQWQAGGLPLRWDPAGRQLATPADVVAGFAAIRSGLR